MTPRDRAIKAAARLAIDLHGVRFAPVDEHSELVALLKSATPDQLRAVRAVFVRPVDAEAEEAP